MALSVCLQFTVKEVVEAEEGVAEKISTLLLLVSAKWLYAIWYDTPHFEVSTSHEKCTALKYTALKYTIGNMQFGRQL